MCLVVFKIFASRVLIIFLCSVLHCGSQQCCIVFSFFISEHTSSSNQHTLKTANIIVELTVALVISLRLVTLYWFNLQWKGLPLKSNCVKLVEWKNYCVHFVFQHAYLTLILFRLQQLCVAPVSISEGISRLISPAVANTKIRLKISNSRISRCENKVKLTGSTHC